ncbi:hypothetical protein [Pectobacterium sp. CHL-2024]|uniref:hypothetical protein n=1 Tax=Pectobacterium sp. CHL-2024 TaxID=3377079 RepID=UPI0037F4C074
MEVTQEKITEIILEHLNSKTAIFQDIKLEHDDDGDKFITAQFDGKLVYLSRGHKIPYIHIVLNVGKVPSDISKTLELASKVNKINSYTNSCRVYSSKSSLRIGVMTHINSLENLDTYLSLCFGSIKSAFNEIVESFPEYRTEQSAEENED